MSSALLSLFTTNAFRNLRLLRIRRRTFGFWSVDVSEVDKSSTQVSWGCRLFAADSSLPIPRCRSECPGDSLQAGASNRAQPAADLFFPNRIALPNWNNVFSPSSCFRETNRFTNEVAVSERPLNSELFELKTKAPLFKELKSVLSKNSRFVVYRIPVLARSSQKFQVKQLI